MEERQEQLWLGLASAVAGRPTDLTAFSDHEIVYAAAANGVCQLLDRRILEGALPDAPPSLADGLQSYTKRQAALDLALNESARRFIELMAEQRLPVLLLKGAPVAHLYYDKTWLRPRSDTDVYINFLETRRVMKMLRNAGYYLGDTNIASRSSRQFQAAREVFENQGLTFDVHYRLSNREVFRDTLPFADCLERSQPVPTLGPGARALCAVDLLLHACIHRIAHGRNTDRNRLIWLYDIHLLFEHLDEDGRTELLDRARERRVGAVCAEALALCSLIFQTPATPEYLRELEAHAGDEPAADLIHRGRAYWVWADFRAQPGLTAKFQFLREVLANRFDG